MWRLDVDMPRQLATPAEGTPNRRVLGHERTRGPHRDHVRRQPRHRPGHREEGGRGGGQRGHHRQDRPAPPQAGGHGAHRGGGDRGGGRRRGAGHRRRRARRGVGGRRRGADGGALRRHRHRGEQRQRDQPGPHARPAGQAPGPDAGHQPARHVRAHPGRPAAPARVRPRARAEPVAAALGRPQVAARPLGLHGGQVRHDHGHAGRGGRRGRGADRRQHPVAAHADRHGRGAEPAGRRRGDGPGAHAGDLCRLRAGGPEARPARRAPATRSSTTRCWPRRA